MGRAQAWKTRISSAKLVSGAQWRRMRWAWQGQGQRQDWIVDNYFENGKRVTQWLGGGSENWLGGGIAHCCIGGGNCMRPDWRRDLAWNGLGWRRFRAGRV